MQKIKGKEGPGLLRQVAAESLQRSLRNKGEVSTDFEV